MPVNSSPSIKPANQSSVPTTPAQVKAPSPQTQPQPSPAQPPTADVATPSQNKRKGKRKKGTKEAKGNDT